MFTVIGTYTYNIFCTVYIFIIHTMVKFKFSYSLTFYNIALHIIIIMILFSNSLNILIFQKDTLSPFASFVYVSIITSFVFYFIANTEKSTIKVI